jgi:hypothetical protein
LHPSKAIQSAFEKPNIAIALVLVLLPSIVFLAGLALYGIDIAPFAAYEIVIGFVTFFVLALVVFALGLIFDGKRASGRFLGTFCALSLMQIVSLAFVLLSLIATSMVFSPDAIEFSKRAGSFNQVSTFLALNPGSVNVAAFGVFLAISACLIVAGIYLLYRAIRSLTETRAFTALILAIITLIILGLIPV